MPTHHSVFMFVHNSMSSEHGLVLLILAIRFISILCGESPKADENAENSNSQRIVMPTNVNDELNEYVRKNESDHPAKNDERSSVRGEPSLQPWTFDVQKTPKSPMLAPSDHAEMVIGPKLTGPILEMGSSSNSFADHHTHSTDQDDLNEAYEFLIKDWEIVPDSKNETNSMPKTDEPQQSEDGQNVVKTSPSLKSADHTEIEHQKIDKEDKIEEEIANTEHNVVKSEELQQKHVQNAKLVAHLTSDDQSDIKSKEAEKESSKNELIEEKVDEKAKKHGKSPSFFSNVADKLMQIKLLRANSKTKMHRSKSINDSKEEKHENETENSSSASAGRAFSFDRHYQLPLPHQNIEAHSDIERASSSSSSVAKLDPFNPFLRRIKSTESIGIKSAERGHPPKTEKEQLVDTLNAALAAQIVRQKQSKYISEWRCAGKYWTKYFTHFFWRNEQVGLCKAWARVDAKVSELLEAWRSVSQLPQGLLVEFLVTDKFEVEVGGQNVDVNQIFGHLRSAHECIFGGNNVEGKKCQNAKILNANEWDKQIKQFKNEAKKLTPSGTFPVGHVRTIKN